MNDFDHLRSAARRYCVANLSRSAAASTRNKPRPLLWVATFFNGQTPGPSPGLQAAPRVVCALRLRTARACLAVFPCDAVKQPCAFCSSSCREAALRLHSSGALLLCRAFTAAARFYSAAPLQQRRAFTVQQRAFTAPRRASASDDFRSQDRHCPARRLSRLFDAEPAGPRSTPGLPARNRANMRDPCAEAAPCARTAPPNHGSTPEGTTRKAAPSVQQPRPRCAIGGLWRLCGLRVHSHGTRRRHGVRARPNSGGRQRAGAGPRRCQSPGLEVRLTMAGPRGALGAVYSGGTRGARNE